MNIDRQADLKLTLGSADLWHDRARSAAVEQRKLLTTLATACLAVFFVTLTGEKARFLTEYQRYTARLALVMMAVSVLFGVLAVFGDARRCYNLARHIQAIASSENTLADAFHTRFTAYFRLLTVSNWVQRGTFLAGIAGTVLYTLSQIS
jgi:hypothetical protein